MCEVQNLPRLHSHEYGSINKTGEIVCNSHKHCINMYLHKMCHIPLMMLKPVISNPYAHVICKICNVPG